MLNDLLDTWESTGVMEFILLTAHEHDPHQEALATVITTTARVRVVDVFAIDFRDLLEGQTEPMHGDEVDTSLMLFLAPHLVQHGPGGRLYDVARRASAIPPGLAQGSEGELGLDRPSVARVGREGRGDLRAHPREGARQGFPDARSRDGLTHDRHELAFALTRSVRHRYRRDAPRLAEWVRQRPGV